MVSAATRKKAATDLNKKVDLPFLNESQEQKIAEKIVDLFIEPFEKATPTNAEMKAMARQTTEEQMKVTVKNQVVNTINKKVDIPYLKEEHEAVVIGLIADVFLKEQFEEVHKEMVAEDAQAAVATQQAAVEQVPAATESPDEVVPTEEIVAPEVPAAV